MTTLLVVAAVVVVLITLALASWLHLDGAVDDGVVRVRVRWALLAAAFDLPRRVMEVRLFGLRVVRRPLRRGAAGDPPPTPRRRSEPTGRARLARLVRLPDSWRFYRRLVSYLLARVHVVRLQARVRVATPDPALTGFLYGMGCAVAHPLSSRWPGADIALEPDFVGEVPGGRGALALRVRIATLAVVGWRVLRHERAQARGRSAAASEEGRSTDGTH